MKTPLKLAVGAFLLLFLLIQGFNAINRPSTSKDYRLIITYDNRTDTTYFQSDERPIIKMFNDTMLVKTSTFTEAVIKVRDWECQNILIKKND